MGNETVFNEDFRRWYRSLDLGLDEETYEKRRSGTYNLAQQVTRDDIEPLIRIAFQTRQQPPAEAIDRLRQPLKATDDSFSARGNDRELQIIAGAVLAELMRRDSDPSPAAALALSVAAMVGARRPDLPVDLAEAAENAIAAQSEATRTRPNLTKQTSPEFPKTEFEKSGAKVQAQQDWAGVIQAFALVTEASRQAHESTRTWCSATLAAANSFIAIQDEELNMLWWLIGERSDDLDQPFADRLERLEKKQKREPNHESLSLTEEDWEDSPTGLHKTVKVSKAKYDRWREEAALDEDGRKWRALWKRARWFVWIVVGGAGALGGDRLLSFILKHL